MKNLLLLVIVALILIALFGDGGLEFSPTLSPELHAQLEFSPSVQYAPQTTNVEAQSNTYIDKNIEQQVIYQQVMPTPTISGEPVGMFSLHPTPAAHQMNLIELQAAYLRNGGELPWLWDIQKETDKIAWLRRQPETWR